MRTDFDPIRRADLPDSFGRTADWLRAAPPPPSRAVPVTLIVLVLLVGAWAWPVQTTVAVGDVIEVLSADSAGADHPALRLLDGLVPEPVQHLVETDGRTLRYVVVGAPPAAVRRWRDAVAALPGTRAARVLRLDLSGRRPLGHIAAWRVLGIHLTPRLSDADLQAALDRAFSAAGDLSFTVERGPDGRRRLSLHDLLRLDLTPGTRISPIPGASDTLRGFMLRTEDDDDARIDGRTIADLVREGSRPTAALLDSLPPEVADQIRRTLARHGAVGDSSFFIRFDTLRTDR